MDPITLLTFFVLSAFIGFEVVSKVSSTLHTPLMSGANAIHGIILVGAVIVAGQADDVGILIVALAAVLMATINLVGGFVVTDRMLKMFAGPKRPAGSKDNAAPHGSATDNNGAAGMDKEGAR
jgi:NAD(P) transhydrogenase subunit alpha